MAFFNIKEKEDMQDDTYALIASLLYDCIMTKRSKNVRAYYDVLEDLHDLAANRLKLEVRESLDAARDQIFNLDAPKGRMHDSEVYENLREVYLSITQALDEAGILFRARINPEEMIAGRGGLQ